jgi:hydrogenase expression/formation protein HypC
MCLGIPGKIVGLAADDRRTATVDVAGSTREISLDLLSETDVAVGDWVAIHMGLALQVVDERTAQEYWEFQASVDSLFEED